MPRNPVTNNLLKLNDRLLAVESLTSSMLTDRIGSGIEFPNDPYQYDVFWHSEYNLMFYYDVNVQLWLSTHVETLPFSIIYQRPTRDRWHSHAITPNFDIMLIERDLSIYDTGQNTATKNFVLQYTKITNNVSTTLFNVNTFIDTTSTINQNWRRYRLLTPLLVEKDSIIRLYVNELANNSGSIAVSNTFRYRVIGT